MLNYRIQSLQNNTKNILPDDVLPGGYSWGWAVLFLQEFDPIQMRYAGQEWRDLVHVVSQAALAVSKVGWRGPAPSVVVSLLTCIAPTSRSTHKRFYTQDRFSLAGFHFYTPCSC